MGNKYTTKNEFCLKTNKTCIYQIVQLNNVELATCSSEKNLDIWKERNTNSNREYINRNIRPKYFSNIYLGVYSLLTSQSPILLDQVKVTSLVYMHDGRLATGSQEHSIKIWTYDTHRCDFTVMAHTGPIRALIQLKDHNLVSGSDDSTIKILDLTRSNINNDCLYMFYEGTKFAKYENLNEQQLFLERLNLKDNNQITEKTNGDFEHPLSLLLKRFGLKWLNLTNARLGNKGTIKFLKTFLELQK